jgi:alkylhydroperoxidase family enzyme
VKSHAAVAAVLVARESPTPIDGEEFVSGVIRDLETSALGEKEKALLRFVDRVNQHSPEITTADMLPLYAVGWDDEAIYYAITVCALFNFYNRWVDASGVHALSDEMHRQGGKRSASVGYVRK